MRKLSLMAALTDHCVFLSQSGISGTVYGLGDITAQVQNPLVLSTFTPTCH